MAGEPVNFLRYPGSKRRMLGFLSQYLPNREDISGKYIEPFLGSGAVFLSILPKKAFLSDINSELIDLFSGIRLDPDAVWRIYRNYGDTKNDYYHVRDTYHPRSLSGRAARSLYLNRTCFKGMWRQNRQGKFNVGYGGQNRRWVIDLDILRFVSYALKEIEITPNDFSDTLGLCKKGDFVFCDPPYRPGQFNQSNAHYSWEQFSSDDQERLADCLCGLNPGKVKWALTISSHKKILNLYKKNFAVFFNRGTGPMPGCIVKNPGEVLITNYQVNGGIVL